MMAKELLIRAGWFDGRKVAIQDQIAAIRSGGFAVWPGLDSVLAAYCFLVIADAEGSRFLWIEPARAVAVVDPGWIFDYEKVLGVRLAPVGGYSHMTVMVGSDSAIYGGFDREFGRVGASFEDAVDGLLCARPTVRLSMTLE